MGNYNPNAPQILGQEWVPILNNDVVFGTQALTQELGHGFQLGAARQVNNLRYYSHEVRGNAFINQAAVASIYPKGQEALSGPIQQVIIPVIGGSTTGAGVNVVVGGPGPGGIAQALRDPSDGNANYVQFTSTANSQLDMNFDVRNYPELQGKRIMNVSLLYSGFVTDQDASASAIPFVNPTPATTMILVTVGGNNYNRVPGGNTAALVLNTDLQGGIAFPQGGDINDINLGDICLLNKNLFSFTPIDCFPWTYTDVFRFDSTSSSPVTTRFDVTVPSATALVYINYVALKVTYCEETRVAYGARVYRPFYGMNQIVVGAAHTKATNPILAGGLYTQTLAYVNPGDVNFDFGTGTETVDLNGCTQLYPITSHPGVAVNVPFPLDDHIGDQFSTAALQILPQLSLHATGGVLTEPHVYGRQIAAQVYGNNVAQQTVYDDLIGSSVSWPQVRYYARRWGATTVPLLLSSSSATISGASNQVSITPAAFDALPEIVDGWREVTLRFPSAPAMGAITPDPVWQWSAVGELAGNRWEILGACAPAVSGFGANWFAQVPPNDRLGAATYQPPVGATAGLSWIPQGCSSPYVTGASLDPAVDAALLFSQDPPTVAGFTLSTLSQTVTGIGLNCGSLPCCIPSGISYNRLTWSAIGSALSLPGVSGSDMTTPDNAALDITGDIELRIDMALTDWTPSGNISPITKWGGAGTRSYLLQIGSNGLVSIVWSTDGTNTFAITSTDQPPVLDGQRMAIRVFLDVDNGAGGKTATFFYAPTIDGPFTQLGSPVTQASTTSIFSGSAPVEIGGHTGGTSDFFPGTVYAAQIINSASALVAFPDMRNKAPGTTSFTDSVGRVWTLGGSSAIIAAAPFGMATLELQRFDPVDGQFRTIMLTPSLTLTGFNDYEARVGQQSVYRIRINNLYNFAGPWSTQVSGAPPTPGVSGACADMTGALIFTTNAAQQGNANAAYVMQWESDTPEENFGLPESGDVVFQQFYNRDGSVAFHGSERGLETFQRLLLIQGGAISLPSLANGRTIRDLAWGNYPYICVRDDLGNRWFATVQIPNIGVRNNRTSYLATAVITETTQVPFAVSSP